MDATTHEAMLMWWLHNDWAVVSGSPIQSDKTSMVFLRSYKRIQNEMVFPTQNDTLALAQLYWNLLLVQKCQYCINRFDVN